MAMYDLVGVEAAPAHGSVIDPRFAYIVRDDDMAQGSTIGAPRCCVVIKPTGAIEKIYSPDVGYDLFGTIAVHFWDRRSKIRLNPRSGEFHIHPERQDHVFDLDNGVQVHTQIFPYNDETQDEHAVPPPAVYYRVHVRNESSDPVAFDAYAFCDLRGNTGHDVEARYDEHAGGVFAWNRATPSQIRCVTMAQGPTSWEVGADAGKVHSTVSPGALSSRVSDAPGDPLAILHRAIELEPGEDRWVELLCVMSAQSSDDVTASLRRCPSSAQASKRTTAYYWKFLQHSVIRTPDHDVNRGVLWAKANMLRVQTYAPTGWCFTNDPTRSNNSVGRDTAWMSFGADYMNPDFAHDALEAYFNLQEPNGKIIEYYDVRDNKWEDYGLNVNDNTPLVVIALWHHYTVTGDEEFLRRCYPRAVRAMDYMLSQRDDRGLVWCTSTATSDWGIIGWRNVIADYRISGASTEVNSECFAALNCLSHMAARLQDEANAAKFTKEAAQLRQAIDDHLVNPENGLYYLTIDVDGSKKTDVTADLIFPVLWGVASGERAAHIISVLSNAAFWTDAGIRTVPRDALNYGPVNGYGLLGGVWVAVTYWYAFAAAKYNPAFMAYALSTSFRHFSRDPRRNNTVPGQFAEWLHGEILVNQGMMLSPWDAPRYLWAAIEGAGGLDVGGSQPKINPALGDEWRWLTAINVPFRGGTIAWIACRMPDGLELFTTSSLSSDTRITAFTHDVTANVRVADPMLTAVAFSGEDRTLVFVGNSDSRTSTTAATLSGLQGDSYAIRLFSSVWNSWQDLGKMNGQALADGIRIVTNAGGFALIEIRPA